MNLKKKLLLAGVVLLIAIVALAAFMNSRTQDAFLTISEGDRTEAVTQEELNQEDFEGTTVNGKGEEKTCAYRGILLAKLLEDNNFAISTDTIVTITAEDNFSAEYTGDEITGTDNIYLAIERDGEELKNLDEDGPGAMAIAFGDKNSKRCVKCVKTISIN